MDDFNLEGMNGPSHIDSPQTRGYRQFNGLTNKPPQAPREQGQTMMAVVEKGEEVAQLDGEDPPHAWPGHFRLMDLPAELRVYIYEFLLPHNMNISFELRRSYYDFFTTRTVAHPDTPQWRMELTSRGPGPTAQAQQKALPDRQDDSSSKRWSLVPLPNPEPAQTQLFLVSKAISAEAKAILYGSNTYIFTINSDSHEPKSWRPPQIFGAFGYSDRLPLLRNLRSISIDVMIQDSTHWDVKRLRTRLEYFVEILKQHADDASQSSLLTHLAVCVTDCTHLHWSNTNFGPTFDAPKIDSYMFGLEGLVGLTGIKHVTVGGLPEWYARCMQLRVQGKGDELREMEWPLRKVKHTKGLASNVKWVSSRQWWQPVWDWKEFAERHGVEMPEDVDKYWMDQS